MTFYGWIFRYLGWAFGLALASGEMTFYEDGHADNVTKLAGLAMIGYWCWSLWREGDIRDRTQNQLRVNLHKTQTELSEYEQAPEFERDLVGVFRAPTPSPTTSLAGMEADDYSSRSLLTPAIEEVVDTAVGVASPELPPPGWYVDPDDTDDVGAERWWDGQDWTEVARYVDLSPPTTPVEAAERESPPAGWYIDPDSVGAERWWDGHDWTEVARHARVETDTKDDRSWDEVARIAQDRIAGDRSPHNAYVAPPTAE